MSINQNGSMLKHMPEHQGWIEPLLKTVSRKKTLAFSRITKSSEKTFTFTEKGAKLKNASSLTRSTSLENDNKLRYAN